MRDNLIGWAMFAVAVIALALFALMFRYEPLPPHVHWVWDRLGHQMCRVEGPGAGLLRGPLCSQDDLREAARREALSEAERKKIDATLNATVKGLGAQMLRQMLASGVPQAQVDQWREHWEQQMRADGDSDAYIVNFFWVEHRKPSATP